MPNSTAMWHRHYPYKPTLSRFPFRSFNFDSHSGQKWRMLQRTTKIIGIYFLDLPSFTTFWSKRTICARIKSCESLFCSDRVSLYVWHPFGIIYLLYDAFLVTQPSMTERITTVHRRRVQYLLYSLKNLRTYLDLSMTQENHQPASTILFSYLSRTLSCTSGMRPHYLWLLLALHVKIIKICQNCCVVIPQIPDENTRIVTKIYNILMSQSLTDTTVWVNTPMNNPSLLTPLRIHLRISSRKPFGHSWPKWA